MPIRRASLVPRPLVDLRTISTSLFVMKPCEHRRWDHDAGIWGGTIQHCSIPMSLTSKIGCYRWDVRSLLAVCSWQSFAVHLVQYTPISALEGIHHYNSSEGNIMLKGLHEQMCGVFREQQIIGITRYFLGHFSNKVRGGAIGCG